MAARLLTAEDLGTAARMLADGKLVAFPTETVYGLGADATNPEAVAGIFAAKGRPSSNPLIVHVDSAASASRWASEWPTSAAQLAEAFWPGPLTIVVPAAKGIAPAVLAGGTTVGLRVPAHAVALALLRLVQRPIAAPSANRSNRVSPTRAQHVLDDLGEQIDAVVDGGMCSVGIESTVCEVSKSGLRILRPGAVSAEELIRVTGLGVNARSQPADDGEALRSPGMFPRHYAPRIPLRLVPGAALVNAPPYAVVLRLGTETDGHAQLLPPSPEAFARVIYAELRRAEATPGATEIWIEMPPQLMEWDAVWDRLRRASTSKP